MKIITYGSRVMDDAIVNTDYEISNECRIVGISPFCLGDSYEIIYQEETNEYKEKMLAFNLNQKFGHILDEVKHDFTVLDLLGVTSELCELTFANGKKVRCTYNDYLKKNESNIKQKITSFIKQTCINEKIEKPIEWDESRLKKEIQEVCDFLLSHEKKENLILVNHIIPYQYIENDAIMQDAVAEIVKVNKFISKCTRLFEEYLSGKVISVPKATVRKGKTYGDDAIRFSQEYYEYLVKVCMLANCEEKFIDETVSLKREYEQKNQSWIDCLQLYSMKEKALKKIRNRKLILLSDQKVAETIENNWGCKVEHVITFEENTGESELRETLAAYRDKKEEFLFLLPHQFIGIPILKILWKYGYMVYEDVILPEHSLITLNEFVGEYVDCYNNRVISNQPTKVVIAGSGISCVMEKTIFPWIANIFPIGDGSHIYIGKNVMADRLQLGALYGSTIEILENTSFAERCYLTSTMYCDIHIGKDCMFSTEVVIHSGDGHAILDLEKLHTINNRYVEGLENKYGVTLEGHVWVGYQAMLLKGSYIRKGSILGTRTVTSKEYPNNCIIAGNPGCIVRKDVYWEREPYTEHIMQPEFAEYTLQEGVDV